ncbi:MAG: tetratricopeptide repeat protein [Thermodesulfovibrionales bacterium]|nr:tetratricopeptide repeat protein [Thermodesulfovibrionales bacterium]
MAQSSYSDLLTKADRLRQKSDFHSAIKIYKKVIDNTKDDLEINLKANLGVGHCLRITGDFINCMEFYRNCIDLADALDDKQTLADSLVGLSLALKGMSRWIEAEETIKDALRIYKRLKDDIGLAYGYWAMGAIYRVAGDIKKSISQYNKALRIFQTQGFKTGIGYTLCGLGGSTRIAGDFKKSLDFYQDANKVFSEIKDKFGRAYSHCGIGNAYRMMFKLKEATNHFKKATRLYEEIRDIVSYSYTLWSMSIVCKLEGRYHEAKQLLKRAQDNFKKTLDIRGDAYCNITLSEIAYLEGKHADALKILDDALKMCKRNSLKLELIHCQMLNDMFLGKGIDKHLQDYKTLGVTIKHHCFPLNMP